jgi:hypothetical protein
MPNIVTRIALVLAVLALPSAALARGMAGGGVGGGLAARGAILGSAMNFSQMKTAAPSVAPIPPPRISVPAIPQFK